MTASKSERQQRLKQRREKTDKNLFARLPALYAASHTQGRRLLQHSGDMTILEWRTLWDLDQAGPQSVRDLALLQRADHSLISRALPDMKRKGYVTMHRDEEDARQMIVALTDAGRAFYEKCAPVMQRRRDAIKAEFTDEEITTFIELIDRFEDFLRRPAAHFLTEEPQDDEKA